MTIEDTPIPPAEALSPLTAKDGVMVPGQTALRPEHFAPYGPHRWGGSFGWGVGDHHSEDICVKEMTPNAEPADDLGWTVQALGPDGSWHEYRLRVLPDTEASGTLGCLYVDGERVLDYADPCGEIVGGSERLVGRWVEWILHQDAIGHGRRPADEARTTTQVLTRAAARRRGWLISNPFIASFLDGVRVPHLT